MFEILKTSIQSYNFILLLCRQKYHLHRDQDIAKLCPLPVANQIAEKTRNLLVEQNILYYNTACTRFIK